MALFKPKEEATPEMEQARYSLMQAENELRQQILQLGQMYYDAHKKDTAPGEFSEMLETIKKSDANRIAYYQNYLRLQGNMMCNNCEAIIPFGSIYCNKCGKMTSEKPE